VCLKGGYARLRGLWFVDKDVRHIKFLEHVPVKPDRDVLWRSKLRAAAQHAGRCCAAATFLALHRRIGDTNEAEHSRPGSRGQFGLPVGAVFHDITAWVDPMRTLLTAALLVLWAGAAGAQDVCEQERSRQEVTRLTHAGTIVSVDIFAPNVTVVVEERAWKRSDPATRMSIAHHIDCATFGPDSKMLRSVFFRSSRSNEQLAEYSQNQLNERSGSAP
jgi:hypothetical protein